MVFGWIMVALWAATVIGWIIYNLYQKNVKLENTVLAQANFRSEEHTSELQSH